MNYFMSEQDALAIIDERMDDIVVKMASGSSASASAAGLGGMGTAPCGGTCIDIPDGNGGTIQECCNCCLC